MSSDIQDMGYDYDIPDWVNEPYERAKAKREAEYLRQMQETRACRNYGSRNSVDNRNLRKDEFEPTTRRTSKKKKNGGIGKTGLALILAASIAMGASKCTYAPPKPQEPDPDGSGIKVEEPYEPIDTPIETPAPVIDEAPETEEPEAKGTIQVEPYPFNQTVDEMLSELKATNGEAWEYFEVLCRQFGFSEEQMAHQLIYMCESPEWADGCTNPVLLCAQMFQESEYISDRVGDGGDAIGLGQFHKCAVDEVNRIYGTHYTYEDRTNPIKTLEMMSLLLKHDYNTTGSTYGMLAMYNSGRPYAIEHQYGRNYVTNVLSRINQEPQFT